MKYMRNPLQVYGQTNGAMQYTWREKDSGIGKSLTPLGRRTGAFDLTTAPGNDSLYQPSEFSTQ